MKVQSASNRGKGGDGRANAHKLNWPKSIKREEAAHLPLEVSGTSDSVVLCDSATSWECRGTAGSFQPRSVRQGGRMRVGLSIFYPTARLILWAG